jgi:hypothetical protein
MKILSQILDWFAVVMTGITFVTIVVLVTQLLQGLDTQWGKINIDLFPKPYVYIEK